MKTEKRILLAFLLNLAFSVFEFVGGVVTGSVAILSDAIHDLGDAAGIGISCFLERISKKQPDKTHTYGYARYSVMGSVVTTLMLLIGSVVVIGNAVDRFLEPVAINYDGMILFAVVGVFVNLGAAYFTHGGHSLNQRAVNLHMLEDVLGWAVVLVGAVVMRFTDLAFIDPVMSIGVAVFILINALKNAKRIGDLLLEKTPEGIDLAQIEKAVLSVDGVSGVHHIHVWSMDGEHNCATMHIVTNAEPHAVKDGVRHALQAQGIGHATLELEAEDEHCHEEHCHMEAHVDAGHGHHHHHHHH